MRKHGSQENVVIVEKDNNEHDGGSKSSFQIYVQSPGKTKASRTNPNPSPGARDWPPSILGRVATIRYPSAVAACLPLAFAGGGVGLSLTISTPAPAFPPPFPSPLPLVFLSRSFSFPPVRLSVCPAHRIMDVLLCYTNRPLELAVSRSSSFSPAAGAPYRFTLVRQLRIFFHSPLFPHHLHFTSPHPHPTYLTHPQCSPAQHSPPCSRWHCVSQALGAAMPLPLQVRFF